jgi:hypothetical protein
MAGAGFKISLKLLRLGLVGEGDIRDDPPRHELRSMSRTAGIVLAQPCAKILSGPDIALARIGKALKQIHIMH